MNTGEIVKDSLNYPLSDWKKILILGIILVLSGISGVTVLLGTASIAIISLLAVIGFLIGFLVNGYMFRIIKSSLDNAAKLPDFNNWVNMAADGAKVFIVFLGYLIVPILVILVLLLSLAGLDITSLGSYFVLMLEIMEINPLELLISVIWPGILNLITILYNILGSFALIGILYMILVIPVFLVAIANMAYYEGEFRSAFRFREILDEIGSIGWINLIKWYAATGILFLILFVMGNIISYNFSLFNLSIAGGLLLSLTLIPYIYMYIARSVALFYMPD